MVQTKTVSYASCKKARGRFPTHAFTQRPHCSEKVETGSASVAEQDLAHELQAYVDAFWLCLTQGETTDLGI